MNLSVIAGILKDLSGDDRNHFDTFECENGIRHFMSGKDAPERNNSVSSLRFALGYEMAKKVASTRI